MDIVFAKTRYVDPNTGRPYDSYTDFWKLVELSGFETCYVDEVDIRKNNFYITCPHNGEWNPHIANQTGRPRNAYLVLWCLERPSGSNGMPIYARSNRSLIYDRYVDNVWISDRAMADEAMLQFVPLGSDYGLGEPGAKDGRKYHFAHMSYITDRRKRVYSHFPEWSIAPNAWPWDNPSRDAYLKESLFALNIHQDRYPFQEPLRLALFAAYGLPVLTEEIKDAYPWSDDICVFHPYDGIQGRLRAMLGNDYTRWYDAGMKTRDAMCKEYNFRKMVLRAVKEAK
jgi:hypothetical protein